MYVCMYVCMYKYKYVGEFVCMHCMYVNTILGRELKYTQCGRLRMDGQFSFSGISTAPVCMYVCKMYYN